MIKPVGFGFNEQTSFSNNFQRQAGWKNVQDRALEEFNIFVSILRNAGINVLVSEDSPEPPTPDSIFPNNWLATFEGNRLVLFPMEALNRRAERKPQVLELLGEQFHIEGITDYSVYEAAESYLEGTGSLILDRENKIAYACLSSRTHEKLAREFCSDFGYEPFLFHASDKDGIPVYHTNVMLTIADKFAVLCADCVRDEKERQSLIDSITNTGKVIVFISENQMNRFAGNMLQVKNNKGEPVLIMSSSAFHSLQEGQVQTLERFGHLVHANLETIETTGGGSARCMLAEIFLEPKTPNPEQQ